MSGTGADLTGWPEREGVTGEFGPALVDWAVAPEATRARTVLLRGPRGAGKSLLLAWFTTGSAAHPATTVHALVPAEGLCAETFAWELGRQLGYGPLAPDVLVGQLARDGRPLLMLVPDLHLAGAGPADLPASQPADLTARLLLPLLELPFVRAVVEVGEAGLLDEVADTETIELPAPGPRSTGEPERLAAVPPAFDDLAALVEANPALVTAWLADERFAAPAGLREAWRIAAPQLTDAEFGGTTRAALLHAAALGTDSVLATRLAPLADGDDVPVRALWTRRDLVATALAPLPGLPGHVVVAGAAGGLGTLNATTGDGPEPFGPPVRTAVDGLAVGADGAAFILAGDGTAVAPDGEGGAFGRIAARLARAGLADGVARVTAVGQDADGTACAVGDAAGTVRLWTGGGEPLTLAAHDAPVTAVACVPAPGGGHTLVLTAGADGTVRLWAAPADPMTEPVERRRAIATALAVTGAGGEGGGPLLAVAWSDLRLHLTHLPTGRLRVVALLSRCRALAFADGRRLVVAGEHGTTTLALPLGR